MHQMYDLPSYQGYHHPIPMDTSPSYEQHDSFPNGSATMSSNPYQVYQAVGHHPGNLPWDTQLPPAPSQGLHAHLHRSQWTQLSPQEQVLWDQFSPQSKKLITRAIGNVGNRIHLCPPLALLLPAVPTTYQPASTPCQPPQPVTC